MEISQDVRALLMASGMREADIEKMLERAQLAQEQPAAPAADTSDKFTTDPGFQVISAREVAL